MNAVNVYGAGAPIGADKVSTLTDKAIRANQQAMDVLNKLCEIKHRIVAPQPEASGSGPPAPPCDHALFAIESAQQYLDQASKVADLILTSL